MRPTRRVNISQVAAASGLGVGTVSRVLNGSGKVSAETRARVLAVIESLGYRPSRLAAALSRGSTQTVAIVVPFLTRPSVVARLAGAIGVLEAEGYGTVVCNVESPEQRDRHLADLADRHRADGVVLVSLPINAVQSEAFKRSGVPVVLVDAHAPDVPQIVVDDRLGGQLATEHLIGFGHRRIAFVGDRLGPAAGAGLGFSSSRHRLAGYRRALRAAGIAPDRVLERAVPHGSDAAGGELETLLTLAERPTAIVAASDTQAIGVLAAAERAGVGVPGELSVIGYDDIEAAGLLGLSTVRQPLAESGARGAALLCALLRGEVVAPRRESLALEVVARRTTGPLRRPAARRAPVDEEVGA